MSAYLPFYVTTRSARKQMAQDELLLSDSLETPLLSVYQWCERAVTGGRGTSEWVLAEQAKRFGTDNYSKRRSGGGIVFHKPRTGLTYAYAIPRLKFEAVGSIETFYRWLHERIQDLLEQHGVSSHLVTEGKSTPKDPCFTHPVTADLVGASGVKIAGAGIWVSKKGFLVQGEIQPENPVDWDIDRLNFLDFSSFESS